MKVMLDSGAHKPERAHQTDAGLDFRCIKGGWLWPFGSRTFDTGVHMALPEKTYGKVESKSGLNIKASIVSCGGTIDEGYTGSIRVKLYNLGFIPHKFNDGDKIAQIIIMECLKPPIEIVDSMEETARGNKGFGSTGR